MAAEKVPPPEQSAADRLCARVFAVVLRHRQRGGELAQLVKVVLRPGGQVRWSTLRRVLGLCGHRRAPTHAIALAVLEQFDCYMGRDGEEGNGPRIIKGVSLVVDLERLRAVIEERWQKQLITDGLPPELQLIAQEYKLGPTARTGGRMAELVTRVHERRADASVYYSAADDYLHRCGWSHYPGHKEIWRRHCEGARRTDIARELDVHPSYVQRVIDLHRARCGLIHGAGGRRR